MYAAYGALPARLKQLLAGRNGAFTYGGRTGAQALLNVEDRDLPPALHPMIRVHGETARKSLYFDPGKILYIEGLARQQSDEVIEELTEKMLQPDAAYSHEWQRGDARRHRCGTG